MHIPKLICRFSLTIALLLAVSSGVALAGSLDSPASPDDPASAMFRVEDIYNRLDSGAAGVKRSGAFVEPTSGPTTGTGHNLDQIMGKAPALDETDGAGVADVASGKTFWGLTAGEWGRQTGVVNHTQLPRTGQDYSFYSGDDGHLEPGHRWPDPRLIDNNDGTVTDNMTGLIWLKNANCFGVMTWAEAFAPVDTLQNGSCDLTDGSSAGDWHLPNIKELSSLIDVRNHSPALPLDYPFVNVLGLQTDEYWSSTTSGANILTAIVFLVNSGDIQSTVKESSNYVWPVRGGQ